MSQPPWIPPPPPFSNYPIQVQIVKAGNGLAIAGFVCGVVGIVLGFLLFFLFMGVILGLLGLVFGLVGAFKAHRSGLPHRGLAIWGSVLGALAIVENVTLVAGLISALGHSN